MPPDTLVEELTTAMQQVGVPEDATAKAGFFGAGPSGYAAGDQFLGVRVPVIRRMARAVRKRADLDDVRALLRSPWHEVRLLGGILLVELYGLGDVHGRAACVDLLLQDAERLNNWDLVDSVAPYTLGPWLLENPARLPVLDDLIGSPSLWRRRIALLASFALIRAGQMETTLRLAERVLADREDLLHKAAGWMLREVGARDRTALDGFLDRYAGRMPRVMLRYALEKHAPADRKRYMDTHK